MATSKPRQRAPRSISSAVLESADRSDLTQITYASPTTEGRIRAVLTLVDAGKIEDAIRAALRERAAIRRERKQDEWHFVARISTRFRSFARSYGHAGAADFARTTAETPPVGERETAERQNLLGLALSTSADLTGDLRLHRQATASYQRANLALDPKRNSPEFFVRIKLNLYSSLLAAHSSRSDLIDAALNVSAILSALSTDSLDYARALDLLASIRAELVPNEATAMQIGIDLQKDVYDVFERAINLCRPADQYRAVILQNAGRVHARFKNLSKAKTYLEDAATLLQTGAPSPLPLSKALLSLGRTLIMIVFQDLVTGNPSAVPRCTEAMIRLNNGISFIYPEYSSAYWRNELIRLSSQLSGLIDYTARRPGPTNTKVSETIREFYDQHNLAVYSPYFDIESELNSSVQYSVDRRNIELAAHIRAELIKEKLPVQEWDEVFRLVICAASNDKSTPAALGESQAVDLPNEAPPQPSRRRRVSSAIKDPLPPLPPGYSWPVGDYGDSAEGQGKAEGGIVAYLKRVWLPLLEAGRRDGKIYVDRRNIAQHYEGVITAIKNYQRRDRDTGERKLIPENLRFPSEVDVNNQLLSIGIADAIKKEPRLAQVVANRVKAGLKTPGL